MKKEPGKFMKKKIFSNIKEENTCNSRNSQKSTFNMLSIGKKN